MSPHRWSNRVSIGEASTNHASPCGGGVSDVSNSVRRRKSTGSSKCTGNKVESRRAQCATAGANGSGEDTTRRQLVDEDTHDGGQSIVNYCAHLILVN